MSKIRPLTAFRLLEKAARNRKGRSPKTRIEEGIANGVLSRSFCPLIREIFHVVDDEHFMLATGAREAGRPNRAPASG
jgi:hypothetical protein